MSLFRRRPVRDQFTTSGIGDVFVLRLAGFLSETRSKLVNVSTDEAKIVVGGRTFAEWFNGSTFMPRTELILRFDRLTDGRTQPVVVDVEIRPRGMKPRNFDAVSKHLMQRVRGYFAVA